MLLEVVGWTILLASGFLAFSACIHSIVAIDEDVRDFAGFVWVLCIPVAFAAAAWIVLCRRLLRRVA